MRNVGSHLLDDKMEEVVTHYINAHQQGEPVHVDANGLPLNIQDDGGGRVTVMHSQSFTSPLCRQVSVGEQVGEGPWGEELLDPESRIAALVAHLSQHPRMSHHHQLTHHKVPSVRDVDASVILDAPMRLYNGQSLDQQEPIVVQVSQLPPLPPLQEMKRCQDTDWFNKAKTTLKDDTQMLPDSDSSVLELAGASPGQNKQQSKKSLPHKKRISRKLKRNNGNCTPQQDIVVINCGSQVPQELAAAEEILPDTLVAGAPHQHQHQHQNQHHHQHQDQHQHQHHIHEEAHHITHEVRPIFICQLCGDFYGEEQLKFYHHLKQHYEPHATIIIENPVPDLGIDKMTNTCIVDNVATLPDSIVELSLENTVPKTMYQPMEKHILYTSSDKTLSYTSNKMQYSMASMDKESAQVVGVEKTDLYDLDKLEMYSCVKCNKSFRKQKQCEAHIKEAHSNSKNDITQEEIGEFSEPEDLMEGIHVSVEEGGDQYEHALLPHLTVDSGHIHQDHVRHWYMRHGGPPPPCPPQTDESGVTYCPVCLPGPGPGPGSGTESGTGPGSGPDSGSGPVPGPGPGPDVRDHPPSREGDHSPQHLVLKEEVLQRIFESDVDNGNFAENIIPDNNGELPPEPEPEPEPPEDDPKNYEEGDDCKKKQKQYICPQCNRVFLHRNSLLYHLLSHNAKQHVCRECGKLFYTPRALMIHRRVHNGDRPYKCEICGREFRQWNDLKYHKVSLHSNQKHFKCEFCGKEFARKYSLNVHRRIHTGERNYKCDYCPKSFRTSSYRQTHMRTHTGDRPYKCEQCEKCFRSMFDLRRHQLIHDRVRNRFDEQKTKVKEEKDADKIKNKIEQTKDEKTETAPRSTKKIALASTTRPPVVKNVEKKPQKAPKKSTKKGAPNVTVNQNKLAAGVFKLNAEYANNVEVFDTRQVDAYKYKEMYDSNVVFKDDQNLAVIHKTKDGYNTQTIVGYKDEHERELAILKPIFRENLDSDKVFRTEADNKIQVFTHINGDRNKDYNVPLLQSSQGSFGDIRPLEREVGREVRNDIQGEAIENVFLERLTAFYNIPAV